MKKNRLIEFIIAHKQPIIIIGISVLCVIIVLCFVFGFSLSTGAPGYTVTFYDDSENVLKIDKVQKDEASIPPAEPEMSYGNVFSRWDTDFSKVTTDLEIHPICDSVKDKSNALSLCGAYARKGESVSIPFTLSGDVQVSGFDLTVGYDTEMLKLDTVYNVDGDIFWNEPKPGQIKINFATPKDVDSDIDICTFKFTAIGSTGEAPITIDMKDIYANGEDESYYSPEFNLIPSTVFIYDEGGL